MEGRPAEQAKVLGINFESLVDGDGVRVTVFFSGCLHRCEGCHNPLSHDFQNGRPFSEPLQEEIIQYVKETPFIEGVTLSGGDPMYSAAAIIPFVQKLREQCPRVNVWVYSGFTYEEIIKDSTRKKLLQLCDVLVDGPFISALKSPNLKYKGSRNQRTIDVQQSFASGAVVVLY